MLEIELVEQIIAYLSHYKIRYSREIRMGIGVPDITLNIGASKNLEPLNDYYCLLICEYIRNSCCVSIKDITSFFSLDKYKTMNYINYLSSKNIITVRNDILHMNRKLFDLNLGKTVSIEAKLKDWKNGLLQAQRYLMFSDYSYLAMPKEKIRNVDLGQLEDSGIGLLAIDLNGNIDEVVSPLLSTECEYKQKYLVTSAIMDNSKHITDRRKDKIFASLL